MKKILQVTTMLLGTLFVTKSVNAQVTTQTLSYTGSSQTFTAPGCLQATITCYGAKGLSGASTPSGAIGGNGGLGAMTQGVVSLTSGQVLNIFVGGMGTGTVGGFNGGGNGAQGGSGAGGGASDIRLNGTSLLNRIMVAGGGGGGGNAGCASATITGGNGGAGGGGKGSNGVNSVGGWGGQGGQGITGGTYGLGCSIAFGTAGTNGTSGNGGFGGNGVNFCGAYSSGGGGGGGYNGGGGGGAGSAGTTSCTLNDTGAGGGGAGGTNYFATSITSTVQSNGVNNGNGYVVISYSVIPTPTISVNSGVIVSGQSFTMVPSGASTYTFSSGSAVVSPTANTSYSVVGSNSAGCVSSNTAVSTVVVIPPCSISNQTVNNPSPSSLCGSGTSTISLDNSENGVFYFLRNEVNNSIIDGPVSGNGGSISLSTGTINATTSYNVNAVKDYGVSLPASDDIVRFSSPFYAYTDQITVESWVYSTGGEQPWAGQSSIAADNQATNVWLWHAGIFYVNNNGSWISLNFPTISNGWTHVASVADANGMYIYYNGSLVASNSTGVTSAIRNNSSSVIDLGHDPRFGIGADPARNSNVTFDNFRVWNVARTGPEVAADANNCGISSSNLVLNTDFLEGSGSSVVSYSGPQGQIINPTSNWVLGSRVCTNCELQMSQTVTVTVNPLPLVTSSVTNVSCNGGTGSGTLSVTGGTPPYTYLASNGSTLSVQSGLMPGSYTYTVTDNNGCVKTQALTITEPSAINLTASANNPTICTGASSTLTANATGGTGTITYTWVSGPTSNVNTVTPTATAVYTVSVTDANNCPTSSTVEVTVNSLPNVTVNSGAICTGQSFTMAPSGATTYTYSNGTDVVSPTANDSYTVTGTDANGCENAAVSTITVNSLPVLTAVTNNTLLCVGQTATLSVSGAITYTWSTTDNTSSVAVSPTVQTTYTVNGTDANGCENTTTVTQDVSACTGIVTLTNDGSINVYPNPNKGMFVVELTSVSKVTVMNALGQVVISETFEAGKHTVNVNNECAGVYYVKVMTNNKQHIIKVIKD
jgi:hypothetical protein